MTARIIKRENEKEEYFGWWFFREKVSESWEDTYLYQCVICGKEEVQKSFCSLGLYTGFKKYPDIPENYICFKFGYKNSSDICCASHSEQEIHSWVKNVLEKN